MSDNPNKMNRFWQELRRRNVVRVFTVYAAAAFMIFEFVDIISEPFGLPDWTIKLVLTLLTFGLIIAVIVSWIFDKTPAGVEKTKPLGEIKEGEKTVHPNSWRIATYVSGVIILGLVVFNIFTRSQHTWNPSLYGESIAVLPFINDSQDQENEFFINGVMGSILNNLQKIKGLTVPSRNSVEQYRGNLKPIPEIAKEMNVSYVLAGSGQKYGDNILLTVQLIDASDNLLWSEQYNREILEVKDLIEIQSEIARQVASEIHVAITPEEKKLIEKVPTYNNTALELFQRGYEEFWRFVIHHDREALKRAERLYRRALESDTTYADVYAGLGSVFLFTGKRDSALIMADKALSFDSQLDHAYSLRGVYYFFMGDSDSALDNLNKAIELNPNFGAAYVFIANTFHWLVNDYVQAIENMEEAIKRNRQLARSEIGLLECYDYLAHTYMDAGFSEPATFYFLQKFELDEDSVEYIRNLAWIEQSLGNVETSAELYLKAFAIDSIILPDLWNYIYSGQHDQAYKWAKKRGEHPFWNTTNAKGYIFWNAGEHERAENLLNQHIEAQEPSMRLSYSWVSAGDLHMDLAPAYAFLGHNDKTYKVLDELVEMPNSLPLEWLNRIRLNPMFDVLRVEERFQDILQKMEDEYKAEHERVGKWLEETGRI